MFNNNIGLSPYAWKYDTVYAEIDICLIWDPSEIWVCTVQNLTEYSKGNVITKSQHTRTASISMYTVLALTVVYDPSESNCWNPNVTFRVEIQI